jgi:diguanylate cyclase (GGDEF)-like protein/PAS domain S-box-containing protein
MSFSLRSLLLIPVVLQAIGLTTIVGYLGYRYNRQLAADAAEQAMDRTSKLVVQDLDRYLQQAHRLNQNHIAALRSGAIDLSDLDTLHRYLVLRFQQFPEVTTILLGTPEGAFRTIHRPESPEIATGRTALTAADLPFEAGRSDATDASQLNLYAIDQQGNLGRRLETIQGIDVRDRPWYQQAVTTGQPGWSPPFQIGASNLLTINAYTPFYDDAQQLQGVFAVNLSLHRLNRFLDTLEIGTRGEVFIVQRDGLLVANSAQQPAYVTSGVTPLNTTGQTPISQPGGIQFRRLSALESSDPLMKMAAQQLLTRFNSLTAIQSAQDLAFRVEGDRLLLQVIPYGDGYGLDWLIVTVVPESDFTGPVQRYLGYTLLISGLALLGAIGFGLWLTERITQPILALNRATQTYRVGEPLALPPAPIQEIEALTQTFTCIVAQLNVSFQAVQKSEQKFSKLLSSLPMGVGLFDRRGKLILLNPKGRRLLGQVSLDQPLDQIPGLRQVYLAGSDRPYPLRRLPVIRALQGSIVHVDNLDIEANGQRIPLEVRAVPVLDDTDAAVFVVAVFHDISQHRRAEQLQHRYAQELEQQVAEQTAVIRARETQLKAAQRIAQMGSWELDAQTLRITWSEELCRIYGFEDREQLPNYPAVLAYFPGEDQGLMQGAVDRALAKGIPYELEHRLIRPDGEHRWVISRGEAVLNGQGQVVRLIGTVTDISERARLEAERKQTALALQQSQDRQQLILDLTQTGSWEFDLATGQAIWSDSHFRLFGLEPGTSESSYAVWRERTHPDDLPRVEADLQAALANHTLFEDEHRVLYPDGTVRWVFVKGRGIYDEAGQPVRMVGVMMDIHARKQLEAERQQTEAELKRLNVELQQLARVDRLTQVANRFQLEESLAQEWQRAKREQQPLTVLMLDIDHFKAYNDYYGHPAGDVCLQQVAQALKTCAHRPGDIVARYGGEEFVMLLPHTPIVGAVAIAQRVQEVIADLAIQNPKSPQGKPLTVSQGGVVVEMTTVTGINPQASIVQADAALYQAKQVRNTYCIKLMTA